MKLTKQRLKQIIKEEVQRLNEAKGKSFRKVWDDVQRKNAILKVSAINKANAQALKNVKKLIGKRVWDNDEKKAGKITLAEWVNPKEVKADYDKTFFGVDGGNQDFRIQITYDDGSKSFVMTTPYTGPNEPLWNEK